MGNDLILAMRSREKYGLSITQTMHQLCNTWQDLMPCERQNEYDEALKVYPESDKFMALARLIIED